MRYISSTELPTPLEDIKNYFESLVFKELLEFSHVLTEDEIADAACIALNRLPTWYIRHSVDAQYYLDDEELAQLFQKINEAIEFSVAKVKQSPR